MKPLLAKSAIILFPIAAFCLTVLLVYRENPAEFGTLGLTDIAPTLLVASAVVFVVVAFIWLALSTVGLYRVARDGTLFLGLYIAIAGLIWPLPVSSGMVDLSSVGVSWKNLAACILSAGFLTYLLQTGIRHAVAFGVGVTLLASAGATALPLMLAPNTNSDITAVSSDKNIFVLSFDALQTDVMTEALKVSDDIGLLKDFSLYSDVRGSNPATFASLSAEVRGNYDFKAKAKSSRELIELAKTEGTLQLLQSRDWQVKAYGVYARLAEGQPPKREELSGAAAEGGATDYLLDVSMSRLSGPYFRFPAFIDKIPADGANDLAARLTNHKGYDWDIPEILTRDEFRNYVARLHLGDDRPVATFMHFTFTHHPVDFDENCEYQADDEAWQKAHQNSAGLLMEAKCAVRSYGAFLNKLKSLGVYDDALVILKSDHGQPSEWNTEGDSRRINGHKSWGYSRYKPFLMIKPPHRSFDELAVDERPFILDDLAVTLCNHIGEADCSAFNGFDLLDETVEPVGSYYMNVVAGPESDHTFETHETISVPRDGDLTVP